MLDRTPSGIRCDDHPDLVIVDEVDAVRHLQAAHVNQWDQARSIAVELTDQAGAAKVAAQAAGARNGGAGRGLHRPGRRRRPR